MKAIITRNIEIRGDRETPRIRSSRTLRASPVPQTLPSWIIAQAIRRGAAEEVAPPKRKKKSDDAEDQPSEDTGE